MADWLTYTVSLPGWPNGRARLNRQTGSTRYWRTTGVCLKFAGGEIRVQVAARALNFRAKSAHFRRHYYVKKAGFMLRYVFLDTETGGLDGESLLTLAMKVTNYNFDVVGSRYLQLKPDDEKYVVSAGGLAVNKIDLVAHDKVAIHYREAGKLVYDFLSAHRGAKQDALIPIGQGIAFDLQQIWRNLMSRGTWESHCSYRALELGSIGRYLQLLDLIPTYVSGSLESWCRHFGIPIEAHHAENDCVASIEVMKNFMRVGKEALQVTGK